MNGASDFMVFVSSRRQGSVVPKSRSVQHLISANLSRVTPIAGGRILRMRYCWKATRRKVKGNRLRKKEEVVKVRRR